MALTDVFQPALSDPWAWRAPARESVTIKALIDGRATFLAMEQAVAAASQTVYLTGWTFSWQTRLIDRRAVHKILVGRRANPTKSEPHEHPSTWPDLLLATAARGVDVRLLIADFDPFFKIHDHVWNWSVYHQLLALAASVKGTGSLTPMVSPHEATKTLPSGATAAEQAAVAAAIAFVNAPRTAAGRQARLANAPGLWPFITVSSTGVSTLSALALTVRPASHHQKTLVVDGQLAFCGGLDLADSRAQSLAHDTGAPPWHDLDCQVDGALAADLFQNFTTRWNHELPIFNAFVTAARTAQPSLRLKTGTPTTIAAETVTPSASTGISTGQLIRTLTSDTLLPQWVDTNLADVRNAYQTAIGQAQQYIYIENQYLRDVRLSNWIIAQWASAPDLQVIIVLPLAPEELFSGTADIITMNGLALQHNVLQALDTAAKAGPHPLGLFSPVRRKRSPAAGKTPLPATIGAGSDQIYVHSKTMVIDDAFAIIGSANLNPRSFDLDTEACIGQFDTAAVRGVRQDLWNHMLGNPSGLATWPVASYVAQWTTIASANLTAAPRGRQGFVIPHDYTRPSVAGASLTLPPYGADELSEVEEPSWVENGLPS
jgi:phosphatidylserine/phosphatidylglycerophosphate/cardiolipin synthase-like enzyme